MKKFRPANKKKTKKKKQGSVNEHRMLEFFDTLFYKHKIPLIPYFINLLNSA